MDVYEEGDCDHFMEAMHLMMLCEAEIQGREENEKRNRPLSDNFLDDSSDCVGRFESDSF